MENQLTEISRSPTTRSAYSVSLETRSKRLQQAVGTPLEPKQLTDQMARLTATFGTPKDRTPDQMRMMVAEWFRVLRVYGSKTVTRAFDKSIETSKWFPTIAEIADHCGNDLESWRDAIGIDQHQMGQKPFTDQPRGPITPEEIAKRAAQCTHWRREFGFGSNADDLRIGEEGEVKASQDMTVSALLLNTCAVRRAKGLATCGDDCSRQSCELRA
jgi:hypothetical protein